jgi:chemotaxis protein CheD
MKTMTTVGLGGLVISADPATELACLGLGSCIAVCAYDPRRHIGAMAHIVLPAGGAGTGEHEARYADTALPALASQLSRYYLRLSEMRIVLCGGASIFPPLKNIMDIGQRNVTAVREGLTRLQARAQLEEVGGGESRTIILDVASGKVRLRTVKTGEFEWVCLGNQR